MMAIHDLLIREDQKDRLRAIMRYTDVPMWHLVEQGLDCLIDKYNHIKNPQTFLVCGGTGYIGTALVKHLRNKGKSVTVLKTDLTNVLTLRRSLEKLQGKKFDIGFNLAADVGGISYTSKNQLELYHKNLSMIFNYFEYVHPICDYTIQTSSACIYPSDVHYPITEENIGLLPDEQVRGYGLAKSFMLNFSRTRENVTTLILTNVYGEYLGSCESFGEKSHVTAALIKRFADAKENNLSEVVLWGDGSQTRDFVHVKDVVGALELASIKPRIGVLDGFNVANGLEVLIKELAQNIAHTIGYTGEVLWDTTKPIGVKRRWLDNSKATKYLGWVPIIDFEIGLLDEITFYYKNM